MQGIHTGIEKEQYACVVVGTLLQSKAGSIKMVTYVRSVSTVSILHVLFVKNWKVERMKCRCGKIEGHTICIIMGSMETISLPCVVNVTRQRQCTAGHVGIGV
jgi:hypothetical protein